MEEEYGVEAQGAAGVPAGAHAGKLVGDVGSATWRAALHFRPITEESLPLVLPAAGGGPVALGAQFSSRRGRQRIHSHGRKWEPRAVTSCAQRQQGLQAAAFASPWQHMRLLFQPNPQRARPFPVQAARRPGWARGQSRPETLRRAGPRAQRGRQVGGRRVFGLFSKGEARRDCVVGLCCMPAQRLSTSLRQDQ